MTSFQAKKVFHMDTLPYGSLSYKLTDTSQTSILPQQYTCERIVCCYVMDMIQHHFFCQKCEPFYEIFPLQFIILNTLPFFVCSCIWIVQSLSTTQSLFIDLIQCTFCSFYVTFTLQIHPNCTK